MRVWFLSAFLFSTITFAHGFGLRLTATGGAYGGAIWNDANQVEKDYEINLPNGLGKADVQLPDPLALISAGWVVPLQLEVTYAPTKVFELLLGVRYGFAGKLYGNDSYVVNGLGAALGWRYYVNLDDPIAAYVSMQAAADVLQYVRVELKGTAGFLAQLNQNFALFLEGSLAGAALINSNSTIGYGGQVFASLGTGIHVYFN